MSELANALLRRPKMKRCKCIERIIKYRLFTMHRRVMFSIQQLVEILMVNLWLGLLNTKNTRKSFPSLGLRLYRYTV